MEKHETGFIGYFVGAAVGLALVSIATCQGARSAEAGPEPGVIWAGPAMSVEEYAAQRKAEIDAEIARLDRLLATPPVIVMPAPAPETPSRGITDCEWQPGGFWCIQY